MFVSSAKSSFWPSINAMFGKVSGLGNSAAVKKELHANIRLLYGHFSHFISLFVYSLWLKIMTLNLAGRLIIACPSPRTTTYPWKSPGQLTWTICILVGTNHISETAEAKVIKFCTQVNTFNGHGVVTLVLFSFFAILFFFIPANKDYQRLQFIKTHNGQQKQAKSGTIIIIHSISCRPKMEESELFANWNWNWD